jgi:hypothetical protein
MADKVLENRKEVYQRSKERKPESWSGDIRNWDLPEEVHLNPAHEIVKVESAREGAYSSEGNSSVGIFYTFT